MLLLLLFGFSLSLGALYLLFATIRRSPVLESLSIPGAVLRLCAYSLLAWEVAFAPVSHLWSPQRSSSSATWLAPCIQLATYAVSASWRRRQGELDIVASESSSEQSLMFANA